MWTEDEEAAGVEPAPLGFSADQLAMRARSVEQYKAGDYQGALATLLEVYEQGVHYPVTGNIAVCYMRLGDAAHAAQWMAAAIEDDNFPYRQPIDPSERDNRAGWLECYFQWSRGNLGHHA